MSPWAAYVSEGKMLKPEFEALRSAIEYALSIKRPTTGSPSDLQFLSERAFGALLDNGWEITKAPPKAREPGWYWVKLDYRLGWIVLNFSADGWTHLSGMSRPIAPPVIGPRIEEPK